jgi:hypothetical protein
MKPLPDCEQNSLKSIDANIIQNVMKTYAGSKASGQGEMAARNAAIVALREALPSWTLRAASDMVNRIIAGSEPLAQSA